MNYWTETNNPSAGTTCIASHAAAALSVPIIATILASQRNQTAAAFTSTLTVRDASIAGTILAQVEFVTAVNASDRLTETELEMRGLKGSAIAVAFAPPAASVTQKVALAGRTEEYGM